MKKKKPPRSTAIHGFYVVYKVLMYEVVQWESWDIYNPRVDSEPRRCLVICSIQHKLGWVRLAATIPRHVKGLSVRELNLFVLAKAMSKTSCDEVQSSLPCSFWYIKKLDLGVLYFRKKTPHHPGRKTTPSIMWYCCSIT